MWLKLTAVGCKLRSSHMSTAYRSSFRPAVVWPSIMPNGYHPRGRGPLRPSNWGPNWEAPIYTSDSEETRFYKKRHKFIARKFFQRWRNNVYAAKRKVALRKVSSMLQKLMRQKKVSISQDVVDMIAEFLAKSGPAATELCGRMRRSHGGPLRPRQKRRPRQQQQL